VLETYDLLLEYRALVVAEVALQVDHCLLAVPGTRRDQLKRVLSHPQALAQCEAFIVREHLEPVPAYDTAGAAKQIQQEGRNDQAAIAAWYNHWIDSGFGAFEPLLAGDPRTGAFCHGDAPGLADIALVPQVVNAGRYNLELAPYPTIVRIYESCMKLDAFAAALPERQPDQEE